MHEINSYFMHVLRFYACTKSSTCITKKSVFIFKFNKKGYLNACTWHKNKVDGLNII